MSKRTVTIILLAVTLVATNVWWLYRTIDFGITHTYAMDSCDAAARELAQLKAMLPVIVRPHSTRDDIVAAARLDPKDEPFEKNGAVWIGQVGIRFTAEGRFIEVVDEPN
jgi:hypothetical protein